MNFPMRMSASGRRSLSSWSTGYYQSEMLPTGPLDDIHRALESFDPLVEYKATTRCDVYLHRGTADALQLERILWRADIHAAFCHIKINFRSNLVAPPLDEPVEFEAVLARGGMAWLQFSLEAEEARHRPPNPDDVLNHRHFGTAEVNWEER